MTVRPEATPTFLASIALEPNRWKKRPLRVPSFAVSDWSERARTAGFDGWELWEPHYFQASAEERKALQRAELPVRIFNTYRCPGLDPDEEWEPVVEAVRELGPQVLGVKFNLSDDHISPAEQVAAAHRWARRLPRPVRMFCEFHGGTVLETPEAARAALALWSAEHFGAIIHPVSSEPGRLQAWLDAIGDRVEHLHWQGRNEQRQVCALADLPVLVGEARAALRARGFGGTQTIEFVAGTGRPGETPERLFAAAVADLQTLRG